MRPKPITPKSIIDDVILFDNPDSIRETLRLMFVEFFSGEYSPTDETRKKTVFHYSILDDMLKDMAKLK